MSYRFRYTLIFCLIQLFAYGQDRGDQLFDNTVLHKIVFESELYADKASFLAANMNEDYVLVSMNIDGVAFDSVGIRRKGGISIIDFEKPPFKIDMDQYVEGQKYDGLERFNLQNHFSDPLMQRDNVAYDLYRRAGVVSPRAAFVELFYKDEPFGMYTVINQIDRDFLKDNFASDEGTLVKGIFGDVELKYGDLSDYSNYINNANGSNFEDYVYLDTYLKMLAIDVLIEDWDSYSYDRHNFYLYYEPKSQLMNFISWDHNLAFDVNNAFENRLFPMADVNILADPMIKEEYEKTMCRLLQYLVTDDHIDSLLLANEMILNTNTSGIPIPSSSPLNEYLKDSRDWLLAELTNEGVVCEEFQYDYNPNDIVINEFVASSDSIGGIQEPDGGSPDWIELYNNSNQDILINEHFYLSDDKDFPKKWSFSDEVILPADDYLIIWADRDVHQQGIHSNFKIDKDGGELIMTFEDLTQIQYIDYSEQTLNLSASRIPNGIGEFVIQNPTFGFNNEEISSTDDVNLFEYKIYPNPATDLIWIKSDSELTQLEIYNFMGQSLLKASNPKFPLSLSSLNSGQYVLRISNSQEQTNSIKFIKI